MGIKTLTISTVQEEDAFKLMEDRDYNFIIIKSDEDREYYNFIMILQNQMKGMVKNLPTTA